MPTPALSLVLVLTLAGRALAQAPAAADCDPAALARLPVQPAAANGIRVQIRGRDGEPRGGAVLATLPGTITTVWRAHIREAELEFPGDPVRQTTSLLLRYGVRWEVDARGEAVVPAAAPVQLFAFAGDAWATALCRKPDEPATLTLAPPRRVAVFVVDGDGRPAAGVAVGIASGANTSMRSFARTGADGAAAFLWSALDEPFGTPCVRLLAATREPVQQPLPASPDTPVRLSLPPTGTVRVVLQGRGGAAPRIALRLATAKGVVLVPPADADLRGARFLFVEPGARVTAEVAADGMATPLTADVPAVEAGKETTVTIDLDAGPQRLAFRLRDRDGRPLARCELHVAWQQPDKAHGFDAITGADGEFELEVDPACVQGGSLGIEQRGADGEWLGYLEVPLQDLHAGRNDRGEVCMREKTVLARGHVVDVHGEPVAGVVVATTNGNRGEPTGRDGAFTLHTRPPVPQNVQLQLGDDGWFFATAPEKPIGIAGGGSCVLRVERAARLLVRLQPTLDGTCGTAFGVQATEQTTGTKYATWFTAVNPRLVLPAGRWNLTLALEGEDVLTIANVYADAGVEGHDARLLALDWRAFAVLATLHVADPDGKPCGACQVLTFPTANGRRGNNATRPHAGTVSLLLPRTGVETAVWPDDPFLRPIQLGVLKGGEHEVRLAPGQRVKIALSKLPSLPPGASLQASLQGNGGSVSKPLAADGTASLPVAPGSWTLFLQVQIGNRSATLATAIPIDIGDGDGDGEKKLEWTDDLQRELDRALKSVHG